MIHQNVRKSTKPFTEPFFVQWKKTEIGGNEGMAEKGPDRNQASRPTDRNASQSITRGNWSKQISIGQFAAPVALKAALLNAGRSPIVGSTAGGQIRQIVRIRHQPAVVIRVILAGQLENPDPDLPPTHPAGGIEAEYFNDPSGCRRETSDTAVGINLNGAGG